MNYPIVYDSSEISFSSNGIAILQNAGDVVIYEKVNGEKILSLFLPRTDENWQYIQHDNFIKVDGKIFIIRNTEELHDSNGLMSNIQCDHIIYDLLDDYIDNVHVEGATAQSAIDSFSPYMTKFKVGTINITSGSHEFTVNKGTPLKAINHVCELFGCEFEVEDTPDSSDGKFVINFHDTIGQYNGVQIRFKKNLKSLKKTVDSKSVITRLWVYGTDDISIDSVNNGLKYIDSPKINNYSRVKNGSVSFDVETPSLLLQKAQDYISKVDSPQITYEIDMVDLSSLIEYGDTEKFFIGDTVTVYDDELDISNLKARIVERKHFPFEPYKDSVVLANFIQGVQDTLSDIQETKKTVDQITSNGYLRTFWLDGVIDVLKNKIIASGAYTTAQVIEDKGILLENTDETSVDYGALYLGPSIFSVANSKDAQGNWQWRTFGTGDGFSADIINAGVLNASLVKVIADSQTTIDGNGIIIDNGTTKIIQNGSVGFKIQKKTNGVWLDQLYIDVNGVIHMSGGSIDWNTTNAPTASQTGALSSSSPQLTHIDSTGVYTGTVSASQITTGTLDANSVNVTNLKASNITVGTLKANQIDVSGLQSEKVRKAGDSGTYCDISGTYGDLTLYYNGNPFFKIYNPFGSVSLQANTGSGTPTTFLNSNGSNTLPQGTWDFNNATVKGVVAKFG